MEGTSLDSGYTQTDVPSCFYARLIDGTSPNLKIVQAPGDKGNKASPAAIRSGIGRIGWHTFRHTFRSLLDETGAPLKVQQELMRHADIRTTMNIYGKAME